MNLRDHDDLLAALATLPAPVQGAARQAATWRRAAQVLASHSGGPRWMWVVRTLVIAHFVPATLVLAGVLYANGAVHQLDRIFGGARGDTVSTAVPKRNAPKRALEYVAQARRTAIAPDAGRRHM